MINEITIDNRSQLIRTPIMQDDSNLCHLKIKHKDRINETFLPENIVTNCKGSSYILCLSLKIFSFEMKISIIILDLSSWV
jgi:hypothetical protein